MSKVSYIPLYIRGYKQVMVQKLAAVQVDQTAKEIGLQKTGPNSNDFGR
jgi:uncharacterized protein YqkB